MPVNPELNIPKKSSPVEIAIEYLTAPELNLQAIRFSNVQTNGNEESNTLLKEYKENFMTWELSFHLSNCATLPETDRVPAEIQNEVPNDMISTDDQQHRGLFLGLEPTTSPTMFHCRLSLHYWYQ